jgi:hypothetical protein
MAVDLVQIGKLAKEKEEENWRFREFLKAECDLGSDEIDQRVFETTRRVWAGIDCTSCANCCRQVKPSFSEEEVDRLARRLAMDRQEFINRFRSAPNLSATTPGKRARNPVPFSRAICAASTRIAQRNAADIHTSISRVSCPARSR